MLVLIVFSNVDLVVEISKPVTLLKSEIFIESSLEVYEDKSTISCEILATFVIVS